LDPTGSALSADPDKRLQPNEPEFLSAHIDLGIFNYT